MIDIKLHELKLLNAQLAEGTVGLDHPDRDERTAWDIMAGYLKDVSPDRVGCLMTATEQRAMAWIAERLPWGSRVLEVGSFLGASAAIMAHANPSIEVKTIDVFDTLDDGQRTDMQKYYAEHHKDLIESFLAPGQRRTRAALAARLAHYPNLELIEGDSPRDFYDQDLGLFDVYIEDATHHNPALEKNILLWTGRLRSGGLIILHDYRPWLPKRYSEKNTGLPNWRFPDVEVWVARLRLSGYKFLGSVSGLAIMSKP
jgi:SAM-dependent methyltransferase